MLDFLEVEEFVGRRWHRWAANAASYPRFPDAAARLDRLKGPLDVFFRAAGGPPGLPIEPIMARNSRHRLTWRQRLGFDEEPADQPRRDEEQVLLPPVLDYFPRQAQNRDHYYCLTAFLALDGEPLPVPRRHPFQHDVAFLRRVYRLAGELQERFPALHRRYINLCAQLRKLRPRRRLPLQEAAVEGAVRVLLGDPEPTGTSYTADILAAIRAGEHADLPFCASRDYRPFLPVPLWGVPARLGTGRGRDDISTEEGPGASANATPQQGKRKARRRHQDQSERDDPLVLNRFEKMLSWAEMVNVNRMVEDEDEEEAQKTSEDIEEITLSPHPQTAATRLRMDLDLAPGAVTGEPLAGPLTYPEWDFRKKCYLPNHCAVHTGEQPETGEAWTPDEQTRKRIRAVRRQFEALRPRNELLRGQIDGTELDMDAAVRSRCDLAATGQGSDQIYVNPRTQARDLAVAILVDASLSTEAWLEDRRIIDVEKEALLVLAHGLEGCGDPAAIFSFTSHRRHRVRVHTLKAFAEPAGDTITRRIGALRPGHYTRMGAALRYVTGELKQRPERHRLLLVLTDGKPNDSDYYEGRYAIEDTRRAVLDAQRNQLTVFGVTIDSEAQRYFPYLFGRGGYTIVKRPEHLASALPAIYRRLIAR